MCGQGLAQATQPAATDPAAYKAAYQSADLFMHPPPSMLTNSGYHHASSAKLNFSAVVHGAAGITPSSGAGSIFPSSSSYWTSPGAAANLYSNIAAASAASHHHSSMSHHHPSHVTSHFGSYPHYRDISSLDSGRKPDCDVMNPSDFLYGRHEKWRQEWTLPHDTPASHHHRDSKESRSSSFRSGDEMQEDDVLRRSRGVMMGMMGAEVHRHVWNTDHK